jgi:hypothetical protein
MTRRKSKYEADLSLVAPRYRQQIDRFIREHEIPADPVLNGLAAGDLDYVVGAIDDDLASVVRMLKQHCPDSAWGSDKKLAKWEFAGKLAKESGKIMLLAALCPLFF